MPTSVPPPPPPLSVLRDLSADLAALGPTAGGTHPGQMCLGGWKDSSHRQLDKCTQEAAPLPQKLPKRLQYNFSIWLSKQVGPDTFIKIIG